MIDKRADLCCLMDHNLNMACALTRVVWSSLTVYYRRRAEVAAEEIGACLDTTQVTSTYPQGSYTITNRWYRHTLMRQPNPSREDLDKVYRGYAALYQWEDPSPPGRSVPTHINPFQIYDVVPTEA